MAGRLLTRRVWKLAAVAAALGVAAWLVGVQAARLGEGAGAPRAAPVPVAPGPRDVPADPIDPTRLLLGGKGEMERLLTPGGAAPLDAVPAGLPVYDGAQRLMGYEEAGEGWGEQVGVWAIEGAEAPAVAAFYAEQAERAGFTRRSPDGAGAHNRWFTRGDEALMIRATGAGREVRLTLILRYTNGR